MPKPAEISPKELEDVLLADDLHDMMAAPEQTYPWGEVVYNVPIQPYEV